MAIVNSCNNKEPEIILIDIRLANVNVWKIRANNSMIESIVNKREIGDRNRYNSNEEII